MGNDITVLAGNFINQGAVVPYKGRIDIINRAVMIFHGKNYLVSVYALCMILL